MNSARYLHTAELSLVSNLKWSSLNRSLDRAFAPIFFETKETSPSPSKLDVLQKFHVAPSPLRFLLTEKIFPYIDRTSPTIAGEHVKFPLTEEQFCNCLPNNPNHDDPFTVVLSRPHLNICAYHLRAQLTLPKRLRSGRKKSMKFHRNLYDLWHSDTSWSTHSLSSTSFKTEQASPVSLAHFPSFKPHFWRWTLIRYREKNSLNSPTNVFPVSFFHNQTITRSHFIKHASVDHTLLLSSHSRRTQDLPLTHPRWNSHRILRLHRCRLDQLLPSSRSSDQLDSYPSTIVVRDQWWHHSHLRRPSCTQRQHQHHLTSVEIVHRTSWTVCTISLQPFSLDQWLRLRMPSSAILWQVLRIRVTWRRHLPRNNRLASVDEEWQRRGSADLWQHHLLSRHRMWFGSAVSRLARDLWWSAELHVWTRRRAVRSVGAECVWRLMSIDVPMGCAFQLNTFSMVSWIVWTGQMRWRSRTVQNVPKKVSNECDDHMCLSKEWSCGDGQCILDRFAFQKRSQLTCVNRRDAYFWCETFDGRFVMDHASWTL